MLSGMHLHLQVCACICVYTYIHTYVYVHTVHRHTFLFTNCCLYASHMLARICTFPCEDHMVWGQDCQTLMRSYTPFDASYTGRLGTSTEAKFGESFRGGCRALSASVQGRLRTSVDAAGLRDVSLCGHWLCKYIYRCCISWCGAHCMWCVSQRILGSVLLLGKKLI